MDKLDIKGKIKDAMLISVGLLFVGKKKIDEVVSSLEEKGLNREEAEKTANEVISAAKEYKDDLVKKVTKELKDNNIFATKEDIESLRGDIKKTSSKKVVKKK